MSKIQIAQQVQISIVGHPLLRMHSIKVLLLIIGTHCKADADSCKRAVDCSLCFCQFSTLFAINLLHLTSNPHLSCPSRVSWSSAIDRVTEAIAQSGSSSSSNADRLASTRSKCHWTACKGSAEGGDLNMSTAAANGQPSSSTKTPESAAKGLKRPRITVLGGGVIGLSAATV